MESVLYSTEVDSYIDSMKCHRLEDIGNKHWLEWHSRLSKLNQQAIIEAQNMREETVKESLISSGKIPVLVYEALCISVWKNKVLPHILKYESNPSNTFIIYSVLYHEAVCVGLLETILFHSSSCETLEDSALDLVEYSFEAATKLLCYKYEEPNPNENSKKEIQRQKLDLEFDIGIRAISILRYFAEYLENLPLSITSRMYTHLDVPLLFTELIDKAPWTRTDKKTNTFKYHGGKWQKVEQQATMKLTQTEAQVWIGLRQLLLDQRCLAHYNANDYRRNQFLKLQKYLHENILDQLSPLIDLKQWLCQLMSGNLPPAPKPPVLLEVIPQIKESILKQGEGKWKRIAKDQVSIFFSKKHEDIVEIAQSLSEVYNSELLDKMDNINLNICGRCGGKAEQKCSRCKNEWYCSRNCQVKNWPQHKENCDIWVGQN